ncbi:MAG TPA: hypothetical protein ENJ18_14480 [Nannocystis exedens]|nr:hypothetical protein [Nannocystis exedens]
MITDTLPTTSESASATTDTATSTTSTSTGDSSSSGVTSTMASSTSMSSTSGPTSGETSTGTSSTSGTSTGDTTGEPKEGECRSDGDCDGNGDEFCFAPGEANCGACQTAEVLCSEENPCQELGSYCDAVELDCPCDEPFSYECRPACKGDEECGPDRICEGQQCVFLSCAKGFVCPETHDCIEGSGGNDCKQRSCAVDSDCSGASQVCVKGRCFLDFGICQPPAP